MLPYCIAGTGLTRAHVTLLACKRAQLTEQAGGAEPWSLSRWSLMGSMLWMEDEKQGPS